MATAGERVGWVLSGLATLALAADAAVGLFAPQLVAAEAQKTGFTDAQNPALSAVTLACAVLYALPQTAVLGAILATAFYGGAICTHFRIGEVGSPPQIICLTLAVVTWAGLWLRDARLRALLPVVTRASRF